MLHADVGCFNTWRSSCYRDERFESFQHW